MSNVTVFVRNNCAACKGTEALMDKLGIEYTVVNVEEDLEEAQKLVDEGWRTMPVVKTVNESWSGTQVDKIKALV
jgi:glutaredoxin-like protein NrdH